ncbi:hypothetical protein LCGC14_1643420, partial [marine sediment metagenome]
AKLLGHRVRGRWDDLGPKDFVPIPAGQIADSSVKLLRGLAGHAGTIGLGAAKALDDLFGKLLIGPSGTKKASPGKRGD